MNEIAEILERELEDAVQVKNKDSLHRYVVLLAKNIVQKSTYDQNMTEFRGDIRILAETMKHGFETIDKRFETINKRFEDMYAFMNKRFDAVDKRFEDMYAYMNKRFDAVDKRFEDTYKYMDKRFEDINKRFTMMFTFMNIGFSILIIITIIFKFLQ